MKDPAFERTFRNSGREALFVAFAWIAAVAWTVAFAFEPGRNPDARLVLGMPQWIFAGVFLPWIAASFVTAWFVVFRMKDDDLESGTGQ